MNARLSLICLFVWLFGFGPDLYSQEKKPTLAFSSEGQFVDWLAKVQFIQKDETAIYYHKGSRFKVMPKGQVFKTKAAIDYQKNSITWIAKTADKKETITTLTVLDLATAQLARGKAKPERLFVTVR